MQHHAKHHEPSMAPAQPSRMAPDEPNGSDVAKPWSELLGSRGDHDHGDAGAARHELFAGLYDGAAVQRQAVAPAAGPSIVAPDVQADRDKAREELKNKFRIVPDGSKKD